MSAFVACNAKNMCLDTRTAEILQPFACTSPLIQTPVSILLQCTHVIVFIFWISLRSCQVMSVYGVRGLDRTIYFHLNLKTDRIDKKWFPARQM